MPSMPSITLTRAPAPGQRSHPWIRISRPISASKMAAILSLGASLPKTTGIVEPMCASSAQTGPLPSLSSVQVLPLCQERPMFTKSKAHHYLVTYRTKQLPGVEDRQQKLKGFNQEALANARVILIGAGGLGGEIGEALVRKGVGTIVLFDHDLVEPSNLNRQRFYKNDLGKPKAHRLARNLAKEGFLGSTLI